MYQKKRHRVQRKKISVASGMGIQPNGFPTLAIGFG
jgi:hypothetical protein